MHNPDRQQKNHLYPERLLLPTQLIDTIKNLESGETPSLELTPEEKERLIQYENTLGEQLEPIFQIQILSFTCYIDYLLSPEGQSDFTRTFQIQLDQPPETSEQARELLHTHTHTIQSHDKGESMDFFGRSGISFEKKVREFLRPAVTENGSLQLPREIPVELEQFQGVFDEETVTDKRKKLRAFKAQLIIKEKTEEEKTDYEKAEEEIKKLYIKRVNSLIAELGFDVRKIKSQQPTANPETLARQAARYDKFLFGASPELDDQMHLQISVELKAYADAALQDEIKNTADAKDSAAAIGLDYAKLNTKEISAKDAATVGKKILEHYGLLSEHDADDPDSPGYYKPDRAGRAPDGKWQIVIRDAFKTTAVNADQGIIKIPGKELHSIVDVIAVLGAHEIEGHVLQHENKAMVGTVADAPASNEGGLRLFKKIGGDRSVLFAECGAMANEDQTMKSAFGYGNPPYSNYVYAMLARLHGGNYLDCIKGFYDAELAKITAQCNAGKITQEELQETMQNDVLRTAVNRALRLFRSSTDLMSRRTIEKPVYLEHSKDAVYLEQGLLYEKLQEAGLTKLLYIGGSNLHTIKTLAKIGLLDTNLIREPDLYALQLWKEMRQPYQSVNDL